MIVYSCPKECPAPEPDYSDNYDSKKEQEREDQHREKLKAHLNKMGYTGKHTGKIIRFGVADGHAEYMLADGPTAAKSFLVHLPYGDAWEYRDVRFIPKKEILKRISADEKLAKLFQAK